MMKKFITIIILLCSILLDSRADVAANNHWYGTFHPSLSGKSSESININPPKNGEILIQGIEMYPVDSRGFRANERIYSYNGTLVNNNTIKVEDNHWFVYDKSNDAYFEVNKNDKGEYLTRSLIKSIKEIHNPDLRPMSNYINGKEKYGFVNSNGDLIIPYQYESAWGFSEGLANVKKDGEWGFINAKGVLQIPYKYTRTGYFKNGLCPVSDEGSYFYIDKNGNRKFDMEFSYAADFEGNIAYVTHKSNDETNGRSTFINVNGKEIFDKRYDDVSVFLCEGLIEVRLNGKKGMCNTDGKEVIPVIYDDFFDYACRNNLYVAKKDGKIGCIDDKNNIIIPFTHQYNKDNFIYAQDDCILVKRNGKYGICNLKGDLVLSAKYDEITPYNSSIKSSGVYPFKEGGQWGILNSEGKIIVAPQYDEINMENNYARVEKGYKAYFINSLNGSYHADRYGYYKCPQNIIDIIQNKRR